jgi:hypothetical protein
MYQKITATSSGHWENYPPIQAKVKSFQQTKKNPLEIDWRHWFDIEMKIEITKGRQWFEKLQVAGVGERAPGSAES